ncbi:hypothetical protein K2W90_00615 [Candidatus Babeliales bacterium]|nr:hypothetical protein [Candidatus Babeliales bacterium]
MNVRNAFYLLLIITTQTLNILSDVPPPPAHPEPVEGPRPAPTLLDQIKERPTLRPVEQPQEKPKSTHDDMLEQIRRGPKLRKTPTPEQTLAVPTSPLLPIHEVTAAEVAQALKHYVAQQQHNLLEKSKQKIMNDSVLASRVHTALERLQKPEQTLRAVDAINWNADNEPLVNALNNPDFVHELFSTLSHEQLKKLQDILQDKLVANTAFFKRTKITTEDERENMLAIVREIIKARNSLEKIKNQEQEKIAQLSKALDDLFELQTTYAVITTCQQLVDSFQNIPDFSDAQRNEKIKQLDAATAMIRANRVEKLWKTDLLDYLVNGAVDFAALKNDLADPILRSCAKLSDQETYQRMNALLNLFIAGQEVKDSTSAIVQKLHAVSNTLSIKQFVSCFTQNIATLETATQVAATHQAWNEFLAKLSTAQKFIPTMAYLGIAQLMLTNDQSAIQNFNNEFRKTVATDLYDFFKKSFDAKVTQLGISTEKIQSFATLNNFVTTRAAKTPLPALQKSEFLYLADTYKQERDVFNFLKKQDVETIKKMLEKSLTLKSLGFNADEQTRAKFLCEQLNITKNLDDRAREQLGMTPQRNFLDDIRKGIKLRPTRDVTNNE